VQVGHHTQVIARDGQHAQLLVSQEGIRVNDGQTHICQVNGIQFVQSEEGLLVQVLQGAVGDFNGSHILEAQVEEEFGTHQDGVLGTHIGHHQVRNV